MRIVIIYKNIEKIINNLKPKVDLTYQIVLPITALKYKKNCFKITLEHYKYSFNLLQYYFFDANRTSSFAKSY